MGMIKFSVNKDYVLHFIIVLLLVQAKSEKKTLEYIWQICTSKWNNKLDSCLKSNKRKEFKCIEKDESQYF